MTMTIEPQAAITKSNIEFLEYVDAKEGAHVETFFSKSEAFINTVGLLRNLYKFDNDPSAIAIVTTNNKASEVWTKESDTWTKC